MQTQQQRQNVVKQRVNEWNNGFAGVVHGNKQPHHGVIPFNGIGRFLDDFSCG